MGGFSGFTAWGEDCGWGWISLKGGGGSSVVVVAGRFVGGVLWAAILFAFVLLVFVFFVLVKGSDEGSKGR